MIMRCLLAILTVAILAGCAAETNTIEAPEPVSCWKSPLYQDHPLAGLAWKPSANRQATAGEVYAALIKADFVLIGEKHDNPDHHWLQAKLVSELAAQGRKAALVFEMLTESQQAPLDSGPAVQHSCRARVPQPAIDTVWACSRGTG